jgi:hypothetical protein
MFYDWHNKLKGQLPPKKGFTPVVFIYAQKTRKTELFDKNRQTKISIFTTDMKQAIVILLILLVFLQSSGKMLIYLSFKINQDYIAKNLCENRANPKMHCNGNCQLIKKLKQADKEQQKQLPPSIKENREVLYCHNLPNLSSGNIYFVIKKQSFLKYKFNYSFSFQNDIFHPPKFSLI